MKKLLLVLFCCFTALIVFAQSKVYTEPLVITVNGESTEPQDASVVVIDNGNQTINFELKNFFLSSADTKVPVGNIKVENLPVTKGDDGLDYITFEGTITIQPGDEPSVDTWVGPMVGEIPMKLQGKMNEKKLYVTIDIDMQETLGQIVYVQLGTDDFFFNGKVYNEQLVLTVNGESSEPQLAGVTVIDNGNQTIDFELKNFFLSSADTKVPVGNIKVENLPVTKGDDGLDYIKFEGTITIQPGDMPGIDTWVGPMFGVIPMKLQGKMNDNKLFVTIDIDLQETMGQIVYVQLGKDNFFATEKVYTEQLVITVNGESTEPQLTGVHVIDNGNQTIDFELKNFFLPNGETFIPVGNIKVENIPVTKGDDGLGYIKFDGAVTIQPGDMEGIDTWAGPTVGKIPMKLLGKMNDKKLFVTIDIDIQETLGQMVNVQVGTDDFINQDEIDAISEVKSLHKSSADIYDLSGRRVKNPTRGIYVVGGKTVLF